MNQTKILLDESDIPTHGYNVVADMPNPPAPPLGPDGNPVQPDALAAIFPEALNWAGGVGRALESDSRAARSLSPVAPHSALPRAPSRGRARDSREDLLQVYKGVSPAGSHKPNTTVVQAYYNREAGIRGLTTETGAGQWGSALALAGRMFGLDVRVFMVKVSYEQKPYRRSMQAWGAEVLARPTNATDAGRKVRAAEPNSSGSLGIAISEAVEGAASRKDTNYALGSVLNHVLLHQTVIGLEAKRQLKKAGVYPDVVIASCGGGSNFGGIAFPFFADKAAEKQCGWWRSSRRPARRSPRASTPTTSATLPATRRS